MPNELDEIGLYVSNYKCFRTPAGFDRLRPFTIIIGRNNTGKSALLDLLEYIVKRQQTEMLTLEARDAAVILEGPITREDLDRVGSSNVVEARRSIGQRISWRLDRDGKQPINRVAKGLDRKQSLWSEIARQKQNPFRGKRFKRLAAERDIRPETPGDPDMDQHGVGATRTIHHFRTRTNRDSDIVERVMLRDLNKIFHSDATFTRIDTREDNGHWEVYLDEEHKGRIALSQSGSGLKTIILVLAFLHLQPLIDRTDLSTYLFGFEELENNLHPAIQRRLLHYLRDQSSKGCRFFLTTHSPIEIDYFARDDQAQVLHVTHDGKGASVTAVSGYLRGRGILDDLDLRASDILQSNGVIWVEGPSDRLYLNRMIDLWSNGALREGAHYQILQYAGSLLTHLTASDPDEQTAAINILTLNRNAAVLMDSDKIAADAPLKARVERITKELAATNGLSWVTAGRTIEHYIPAGLLQERFGTSPGQYEDAIAFITAHNATAAQRLPTDKVALARTITPHFANDALRATYDLADRLDDLCNRIRAWNKID